MPLPDSPTTIHGGCNCSAIRYTIRIPPLHQRPIHPFVATHNPNPKDGEPTMCRLPFTAWDHCNDCRTATGALFPAWLCTPADNVTVTCVTADTAPPEPDLHFSTANVTVPVGKYPRRRTEMITSLETTTTTTTVTRPGLDMLSPPSFSSDVVKSTWIRFHKSSDKRYRSFCGRCGTPICYNYCPLPEGWPDVLDIVLGTIDREDLEREVVDDDSGRGMLEPERQMWSGRGIPWLRRAVWGFDGPKHSGSSPTKLSSGPDQEE